MADIPKTTKNENIESLETDEIPPDTDLKRQYQDIEQSEEVNINQEKAENDNKQYQIKQESQENNNIVLGQGYAINEQGQLYQINQTAEFGEAKIVQEQENQIPEGHNEFQEYKLTKPGNGYQIIQPIIKQITQKQEQIYKIGEKGLQNIPKTEQGQTLYQMEETVLEPLYVQINDDNPDNNQINQQIIQYQLNQFNQANQAKQVNQVNQQAGSLYNIITESQEYDINQGEFDNLRNSEEYSNPKNSEDDYKQLQKNKIYHLQQQKNKRGIQGYKPPKNKKKYKKNTEPKDSLSKIHINSKTLKNSPSKKYKNPYITRKIPPLVSFHNIYLKKGTINSYRNKKIDKENLTNFVEIPREEYEKHANNETLFFEGGINTGSYKFRGEEMLLKQEYFPGRVQVSEDEVMEEITRRTNRKEKKIKYEVIDKFYTLTEFERKNIKQEEYENDQIDIEKEKEKIYGKKEIIENINDIDVQLEQKQLNSNIKQQSQDKAQVGGLTQGIQFQGQAQGKSLSQINMSSKNGSEGKNYSMSYKMSKMSKKGNYGSGSKSNYNKESASSPLDNYSRYLLEQINKIRVDPQSFIGVIEDAKANIAKSRYGGYVYKGKIKIALSEGEPAFNEAIDYLKNTETMEILEFSPKLTVQLPQNENELKDSSDLRAKVEDMVNEGISIKSYWRDVIRDPEISFLLMIVDDNGARRGMRRKDILNPKMKYIGISSTEINGSFVCYITLSTKLME